MHDVNAKTTHVLVVFGPRVLLEETVNHLLHRQVRNQLVLSQMGPGYRVKVTDSLQKSATTNQKKNQNEKKSHNSGYQSTNKSQNKRQRVQKF